MDQEKFRVGNVKGTPSSLYLVKIVMEQAL